MSTTEIQPKISPQEVAAFYNSFGKRLLRDYVYGNPRVAKAIDRVCSVINETRTQVLDVGCGIGTSADQYKIRCPWVTVHGVDISPKNVSIGRSLFETTDVRFSVSEMEEPPIGTSFDVVALIDVYEHIPRSMWPKFNDTLSECLSPNGVLVLTTPSPWHQAYLAENKPEALQIIDECVELPDILRLQEDVGGCVTCYEFVSVWNTYDYLHVIIDRNPEYLRIRYSETPSRTLWQRIRSRVANELQEQVRERKQHVKSALGIDVE